jgi:hypothetical protein
LRLGGAKRAENVSFSRSHSLNPLRLREILRSYGAYSRVDSRSFASRAARTAGGTRQASRITSGQTGEAK